MPMLILNIKYIMCVRDLGFFDKTRNPRKNTKMLAIKGKTA
jgi:hypothetical protein